MDSRHTTCPSLQGRHILLGITGSIAAYKAAVLCRLLKTAGAEVRVVMTPLAKQFITPLTMATLAKNPILVEFFDPENGAWNSHVSLGEWADCYLIAPATANTLAKMATGVADNLLLTTYLSARCPVVVAPAMDLDMYAHPATQHNLDIIRSFGNHIIEPAEGELASHLTGKGRMEEPERIAEIIEAFFTTRQDLDGKHVLITAGPTYERIDPVRFIGNYSSGKMGFALAEECAARGARVTLVAGPVQMQAHHPAIQRVNVETAAEMLKASLEAFSSADAAILCAAVADFTPDQAASSKIKRERGEQTLHLIPTQDIAATLGAAKRPGQRVVGFALETDNEESHAREKLVRKHLDFIVLNSLRDAGAGFRCDTNKVTILSAQEVKKYPLKTKSEVAKDIIDMLCQTFADC